MPLIRDESLDTNGNSLVAVLTYMGPISLKGALEERFGRATPGCEPEKGYEWEMTFKPEGAGHSVTIGSRYGSPRIWGQTFRDACMLQKALGEIDIHFTVTEAR